MTDEKIHKDPNGYNVRAVERALQILGCFDDAQAEKGVSEVAEAVGLHKATVHRLMTTLLNFGYLERAADGEKYRLGLRLAELGFLVVRRMDLRREALPQMKKLVEDYGETCDLSIFDANSVFYIEVLRGNHALTIAAAVGQRLPAASTASGKLFLAHLSADKLDAYLIKPLKAYTAKTITDPAEFRKQLEIIRERGYAVDDEEFEAGVYAISAPIYNRQGGVVAAISIISPVSRMTPERINGMTTAFRQAAREVSLRLGWLPKAN